MNEYSQWFETFRKSKHFEFLQKRPIVYFSVEYALSDMLPTYAGGLGILAGDFVKELADQQIPAIAVGILYHHPYGKSSESSQEKINQLITDKKLNPVLDSDNNPILIKIPIQDTEVIATAWLWQQGTIPVYLLDTNVPENKGSDREITRILYDADKETRLKQEMVLGIGGFRLIEKLGIDPSIIHMNEGHSAMFELELIHHEMIKRKIGFQEATQLSGHHVVFTNHTLVPSGNETFSRELFTLMLGLYASELEVPVDEIMSVGAIEESKSFSMTLLALHLAGMTNAVSKIHSRIAKASWPNYTFESVTNGIHLKSWDSTTDQLVESHKSNKQKLLEYIKKHSGNEWKEDQLLVGWARRMVPYKRPLALFEQANRLRDLASKSDKPIRFVVAGIAPPNHPESIAMLESVKTLIENELKGIAVYLPDYDTTLAKLLTSGCDVWLNTPVVGSEACGTSGMKACLNGTLPASTKDGWIDEVDLSDIGWILDTDSLQESILTALEKSIAPLYYNDKHTWEFYMKNARNLILTQFSTTRMLKNYFEKMYLPIITTSYAHYFS